MEHKRQTLTVIKNLLLSDTDIHDLVLDMKRELRSIEPVTLAGNTDVARDSKYLYYGKIHSFDGVTLKLNSAIQNYCVGSFQLEAFFDEIVATSNQYCFIGFKILLNN